jgi:hypothetical protein
VGDRCGLNSPLQLGQLGTKPSYPCELSSRTS